MLSKLEAEGYITRKPDTADSRAMIVYPTRKSYDICAALEGFGNNWVNYLTSDMSDIEFAAFFSMLEKISDKAVDFFSDAPIWTGFLPGAYLENAFRETAQFSIQCI